MRAAIYTRISKDREGRELGVQRQEGLCRDLAAQRGYEVVAVFQDNDISASTRSSRPRPSYDDMLRRARLREFDVILAYSNSRLTRRPQEFNDLITLHEQHGIVLKTIASGEQDLSTADGRAVARTIAAWDAAEAERASERIKAAKAQRSANGQWHGGAAPYGYRTENTRLVVNPDEAAQINEAAQRILAGDSLHSIVKDWNDAGRWTRQGKHWRQTNLRSILMNRSLLGETKAGTRGWEPVLDRKMFDRLYAIFTDPARKVVHSPGVKGGKYSLGGGITVCGTCGYRLITGTHHGRAGLKCTKVVNGPDACGGLTIQHDPLEAYVFDKVVAALEANPRWGQRRAERDNAKVAHLEAERGGLVEQRRRLARGVTLGLIEDTDASAEAERIRLELARVERAIDSALGQSVREANITSVTDWREWSSMRRRNFLRQLVKRIEVHPHPKGMRNSVQPTKNESDDMFVERRKAHWEAVLNRRVVIVPR